MDKGAAVWNIYYLSGLNPHHRLIRSILKTAADPQIISFAGGLPNPVSFPKEELLVSMERIVRDYGSSLFQYSITAGLPELRQYIADRYNRQIRPETWH